MADGSEDALEKKFASDEIPLKQLLGEAHRGALQLPDFQRGWVWDNDHISSLLASISLSYPIGAVMTLQTGNPDVKFKPRVLEGAEPPVAIEPETLLLDGQQRTTSLYLALMSGKPVPTRDAKGKALSRWYYADIDACCDPHGDREDAIFSIPEDRTIKTFNGQVTLDLSSREHEIAARMFPLAIVLDPTKTMEWHHAFVSAVPEDMPKRMSDWMDFHLRVIQPFEHYQVPTIQLVKSTPKEAVCQVFEKVNTGGVSLTVFELLTATFAADDFNLRDDWDARRAKLDTHDVLGKVDATQFLQVVTLLATHERRATHLKIKPGDEKAPAVSCKRRDILRLDLDAYKRWSEVATDALVRCVPFLHTEHIFKANDVPYATQLVPLAGIFAVAGKHAEGHAARQMIARWFWSGVLGEMYGGSTETRFALDLPDVVTWLSGAAVEEPRTVREAQFQADRLLTLRTRNSAAYKGLYAMQMKRGAQDLRTGQTIDIHAYIDDAIDVHHIFPQAWCEKNDVPAWIMNCIVNKTAIDAHTNRRIGGNAPSAYLKGIEKADKIASDDLDALLRSHDIDAVAVRQDDFPTFFNRRFERLLKQVEAAMGKPVNRSAEKDESPYADPIQSTNGLTALLAQGESKVVEFKSTGRLNLFTGDKDPKMEWAIVKSVAGFMNAAGGTLLVGVADDGQVVGIEQDFPCLKKPTVDGWDLWLTDLLATVLGKSAASEVDLSFFELDGTTVARVDVGPAATPVFASRGKDGQEAYLVRINSTTQELAGGEALKHQQQRWHV